MAEIATPASAGAHIIVRQPARRYFVLGMLTFIYALNFLDRTIFNVLIEPIKKEFALSDTTMGLLAGFGFVLFYSLLGILIGTGIWLQVTTYRPPTSPVAAIWSRSTELST